jgi:ABC-type transporter Mla subunit MlaD
MNTKQTVYNILASSKTKEVTEVNLATVSELSAAYNEFAKMREDVVALLRESQAALPKFAAPAQKLRSLYGRFDKLATEIDRMTGDFEQAVKQLGLPTSSIPNYEQYNSALSNFSQLNNDVKEIVSIYSKIG